MKNGTVPEKHFYTIGDVSRLTGAKPHVLRYWESQFRVLRPARRYSGHRKYTQADVDLISRIRFLIEERKFTLAGARREMNLREGEANRPVNALAPLVTISFLRDVKTDIEACLDVLNDQPTDASSVEASDLVGAKSDSPTPKLTSS